MAIYATKIFARFASKAGLDKAQLLDAAARALSGVVDADLGGGVFKQRVAREGGGKSGGFRTIVVFKIGGHMFFVHGFAKSEKANVSAKELKALKALARVLTSLDAQAISKALAAGELMSLGVEDGQDAKV